MGDTDVRSSPQPSGLLDLSRQQRNLLLMRPVFLLERDKMKIGDDVSGERVFAGIDTHYLALSALDLMMEATTISSGSTSQEVIAHLAEIAGLMAPALTSIQARRVGEVVLDALDNKSNNHKEFSFDYFDAPTRSTKAVRFRLVKFEPDSEDVYRYRPTPEGYLVYLGMLDLAPEDSQELMEKMLDLLVQRGRFEAALDIARRARKLSIEYRQLIRDRLNQAYRAPGSVHWTRDMTGRLDTARGHVRQRQAEDARMEEAVSEALTGADELRTRESLVKLRDTLHSATVIRMQLVNDINASPEKFIRAQNAVFRARRATGLPDLEPQMFPQLMSASNGLLAEQADSFISAFYPPVWPKLYDLNTVFAVLLDRRPDETEADLTDGELVEYQPMPDQYPKALVDACSSWVRGKLIEGARYRLDEVMAMAEAAGFDETFRRCLLLQLFKGLSAADSDMPDVRGRILAAEFHIDIARGHNLEFIHYGTTT